MTDEMLNLIERLRRRRKPEAHVRDKVLGATVAPLINPDGPEAADRLSSLEEALREAESEARRFAGLYPPSSDGRNTLVILADKIAALSAGVGR